MANRDTVAKRLNSAVNQIHRWVDIVFPELRQVFKVLTCTSSMATLRLFTLPKEISRLTTEQVITGWKQYVKRHAGLQRAKQLVALGKRSVGATQALQAYNLHLGQLLEEYDLAQRQLKQIEQELHNILERIPYAQKLFAICGVNATSLAGVLGEAGDLCGYVHGNALLRHAGLNLTMGKLSPIPWVHDQYILWYLRCWMQGCSVCRKGTIFSFIQIKVGITE